VNKISIVGHAVQPADRRDPLNEKVNPVREVIQMKFRLAVALSVGAVSFALIIPQLAQAQSGQNGQASPSTTPIGGTHEAALMVPARAFLLRDLDAKKDHSGDKFEAKLSKTIHLKNGPELPKGTILSGVIADDEMQIHALSKLALRITTAGLSNGTTIPVKATIVGIDMPQSTDAEGYPIEPGDESPNYWNTKTLAVDQIDALPNVDIHSRIAGKNSAVFASTKNDKMKLQAGTELELAIAAQNK
jgi:hypothetical protein